MEAQLKAHFKKEHANCAFCDRKCSSQRELQRHIESQHSGSTLEQRKNIPCTYPGCNKSFTKKYNLSVHIRSQHEGVRYICGTFDVSKSPDLAAFDTEDACGKDFVSKANLEDHIRTAHLGLPSQVNANRKKFAPNSDDEDEGEDGDFRSDDDNNKKKSTRGRKGKQQKPSAIDELLGISYAADARRNIPCLLPSSCAHLFIRVYDLQQHMRSKHRLSTPEIEDLALQAAEQQKFGFFPEAADGDGDAATDAAANGEAYDDGGVEAFGAAQQLDLDLDLDAMYGPADVDWEMQRRALEDGPFWVGAAADGGGGGGMQNVMDQWPQDELEMRKLIGGEEEMGASF